MKLKNRIKSISKLGWVAIIPICISIASCSEKIDDSNLYTFTGETIEDYLTNRSETFSDFNYILQRSGYDKLLATYGTYTCFAPTNKAVEVYIDSLYNDSTSKNHNSMTANSLEGLSDSLCNDIAQYHLSNTKVLTTDMSGDATVISTMLGRDLTTSIDSITGKTVINAYSVITSVDNEVENGVVQVINNVLRRSNSPITGVLANHSEFSIFYDALQKTGLADSLTKIKKSNLNEVSNNTDNYWVPDACKYGFTIFAETNDVLKANGITNVDSLISYANRMYKNAANKNNKGWYDYMIDNGIKVSTGNDYTNRFNALNMFIAYHILRYSVPLAKLTYSFNESPGMTLFEYYRTMLPYTLFKVTRIGSGNSANHYINRCRANNTLTDQLLREGSNAIHATLTNGIVIGKKDISAVNGYIHPINNMLVYNDTVPKYVLNERMRFDDVSLMDEMMSNSIRSMTKAEILGKKGGSASKNGGNEWVRFPSNYFENIVDYNGDITQLRYLPGRSDSWDNYQGDEFLCIGAYDFALHLPPVPDGTYELRMGYTANGNRGMVQVYLGNSPSKTSMKAVDIPLDMRLEGTNVNIGWTDYTLESDYGVETDKAMHNRGYMRGPLYFVKYGTSVTGRANNQGLRRIIVKQDFKQGDYWLRFKTVLPDNTTTQFHLDYIEFCPSSVYNNATYVEDMF